jgi:hypothetical protein
VTAWIAIVALAVLVAACGSDQSAAGVVVDVESTGPGQVAGFVLRTATGEQLDFAIGKLELDATAFPAVHLQEHLATSAPIAVSYRIEDGERVAHRLVDAPWFRP